jgi:hypothetical protein
MSLPGQKGRKMGALLDEGKVRAMILQQAGQIGEVRHMEGVEGKKGEEGPRGLPIIPNHHPCNLARVRNVLQWGVTTLWGLAVVTNGLAARLLLSVTRDRDWLEVLTSLPWNLLEVWQSLVAGVWGFDLTPTGRADGRELAEVAGDIVARQDQPPVGDWPDRGLERVVAEDLLL